MQRALVAFEGPCCNDAKWRYLYRAIDKYGVPVDFLLMAKRDLDAAKRFFRKALKDAPLLAPGKIGTDGANVCQTASKIDQQTAFKFDQLELSFSFAV